MLVLTDIGDLEPDLDISKRRFWGLERQQLSFLRRNRAQESDGVRPSIVYIRMPETPPFTSSPAMTAIYCCAIFCYQ